MQKHIAYHQESVSTETVRDQSLNLRCRAVSRSRYQENILIQNILGVPEDQQSTRQIAPRKWSEKEIAIRAMIRVIGGTIFMALFVALCFALSRGNEVAVKSDWRIWLTAFLFSMTITNRIEKMIIAGLNRYFQRRNRKRISDALQTSDSLLPPADESSPRTGERISAAGGSD